MSSKQWILLFLCIVLPRLALGEADAGRVTVGIAPPMAQPGQSPERAESMRQDLISQLRSQSIDAVALTAPSGGVLQTEAEAKHCNYVLYTRLDKKHGISGVFGKLSALTSSSGQRTISAAGGAAPSGPKRGDTVTLDYRLLPTGSSDPVRAETLAGKVDTDGQDVLGPLVAQLAGSVAAVTRGGAAADGQAGADAASHQSSPGASSDTHGSKQRSSLFGGLWSHKKGSDTAPTSTAGADARSMDCAKLVSMPGAMMTLESCRQMQGAQQAYDQAAADPGAAHPGDDQMTCAEIIAELKRQPVTGPDQSQRAAAQATGTRVEAQVKEIQATAAKEQAEAQTAVAAASAADTATEVATLGLVRGRALQATEKALDARHQATNERIDKENQKVSQQMVSTVGDLGSGMGKQLQANPRLARLMQLANAKRCKSTGW